MASTAYSKAAEDRIALAESLPFFAVHLLPFLAIWTGVRPVDVAICLGLFFTRLFFITAGYHRYFSHRSFKLNRVVQFLFAFGGGTAAQKGALWWAGWHRVHHRYSDTPEDVHSPLRGFYWSHMGWILARKYNATPFEGIKDFAKYPELRWLNRWHLVPPIVLGLLVWLVGGWSALLIGFFLSTVILWHSTFTINSLAHLFGRRRYVTSDTSRNSLLLSLLTWGEGWHNNHHHYQASVRQGFYWWEIDISYYVVKLMSWIGLATDLRQVPEAVLTRNLVRNSGERAPEALEADMTGAHEASPLPPASS